jgi:hypothetical protein
VVTEGSASGLFHLSLQAGVDQNQKNNGAHPKY